LEAFIWLVLILGVVFLLDLVTPENISVRPLFVVPVLLVGLVNDKNIAICLAFIAASLFTGSYYWNHPSQTLADVGANFFVSLIAYQIVAYCSLLAARSIALFSKLVIDYQRENLALKRKLELQKEEAKGDPSDQGKE